MQLLTRDMGGLGLSRPKTYIPFWPRPGALPDRGRDANDASAETQMNEPETIRTSDLVLIRRFWAHAKKLENACVCAHSISELLYCKQFQRIADFLRDSRQWHAQ